MKEFVEQLAAQFAVLGLKWHSVVGGAFGALASLKLLPGMAPLQRITTFFFGWAAAAFLTPLVCDFLGLAEKHYGSAGFLIGLLGLSSSMRFVEALPAWIEGARQKFFGGTKLFGSKAEGSQNGTADQ